MILLVCAVLSLALQAGFYLVVAWAVLSYLAYVVLLAFAIGLGGTIHVNSIVGVVLWGYAVVVVLRAVVKASGSGEVLPGSIPVSAQQAPGLWALARQVAVLFGTAMPAEIRVTAEPNAAVGERTRLLGLFPGRRTLYVGVPLLIALTTDEVRAVLCHEFGHYASGHTRLGAITHRGHSAMADARREVAENVRGDRRVMWSGGVLVWAALAAFGQVHDLLWPLARRRLEIAADRAASSVIGPTVLAGALRSADATAAAWADFRVRHVEPMERRQRLVAEEIFSPFQIVLNDPDHRDAFARRRARPPADTGWRDSHPALRRRLDLLARQPDGPRRTHLDPGPLLADPAAIFRRTTPPKSIIGGKITPWQEWLEQLAEYHAAPAIPPVDPRDAGHPPTSTRRHRTHHGRRPRGPR